MFCASSHWPLRSNGGTSAQYCQKCLGRTLTCSMRINVVNDPFPLASFDVHSGVDNDQTFHHHSGAVYLPAATMLIVQGTSFQWIQPPSPRTLE